MLANKKELEEALACAASDYSYENNDKYFSIMVEINCDAGWVKAEIKEGGQQ